MKKMIRNYKAEADKNLGDSMRLHLKGMELRQKEQTAFDALALAIESGADAETTRTALRVYGLWRRAEQGNAQSLNTVQSSYAVHSRSAVQQQLAETSGILSGALKGYMQRMQDSQNLLGDQIAKRMIEAQKNMAERDKKWLAFRTAPKRTNSKGDPVYPGQRDIAAAMGMSKTTVNALEQRLESMKAIRDLFAQMGVPLRKPRGATGTKRKNVP